MSNPGIVISGMRPGAGGHVAQLPGDAGTDGQAFRRASIDGNVILLEWFTPGEGGGSGDLLAANNLSDLDDAATARSNLGLGNALQSGDSVSDLVNDAGYITGYTVTEEDVTAHEDAIEITESQISDLGTYLVAADIANFETSTQLNSRDTDNRNRDNHTGTQLAATISDFDAAVGLAASVTANTSHRGNTSNPHSVTATQVGLGNVNNTADADKEIEEAILIPITASGADATAALEIFEFRVEEAFSLGAVSIQCDTDNPPTGSAAQIDVNKNGTSIFATKPTIDAGEYSSATAATPPALTTTPTEFAIGDIITIDLDQVGASDHGKEYKVVLHTTRTLEA